MTENILDDLVIDRPKNKHSREFIILRFLVFTLLISAGLATCFAWSDIKTIVHSGFTAPIPGIILVIYAFYIDEKPSVRIGFTAPLVSIFCFLVIFFLDLSVEQAALIIPSILCIYTLFIGITFIQRFLIKN